RGVDAGDLGLQHREVAALHLPAQRVADRRADGRRAEARSRHLVQQRLEQVVVGAVDQRDLDVGPGQRAHGLQAAETAADDDDTLLARTHCFPSSKIWGVCSLRRTRLMWLRSAYSSSA